MAGAGRITYSCKLKFHSHAWKRMRQRKITPREVRDAVAHYETDIPGAKLERRVLTAKTSSLRTLAVVIKPLRGRTLVASVWEIQ